MTRRSAAAVALLSVPLLVLAVAFMRGGRVRPVHRASGRITALVADERGPFWIEAADPATGGRLFALTPSGDVQSLSSESGLVEVASSGTHLLALRRRGETGEVLVLPRDGGSTTIVAQGLARPAGLAAGTAAAYWTETRAARIPFARHMPVTQARTVLRAMALAGDGAVRTVACLDGREGGFAGALLGEREDRLCFLDVVGQEPLAWSVLRTVPSAGGVPEALAIEPGPQEALLVGQRIYLTGASDDAGDPAYVRRVRRLASDGATETLTDWLPSMGRLIVVGPQPHYASSEGLFRLPQQLAPAPRLGVLPPGVTHAAGHGGYVYLTTGAAAGDALWVRAVTAATRIRDGLRLRRR